MKTDVTSTQSSRTETRPPVRTTPAPERLSPPHPGAVPEPDSSGYHDLSRPDYYLNREMTWLHFNFRVLSEAEDPRVPLLERVRFLAIVSSNLDHFFMKRIGGLKQQVGAGLQTATVDGRTPEEQIDECYRIVRELERRKREALYVTFDELAERGIVVSRYVALSADEQAYLRDYYHNNIFPLVTPQATDPAHPFPFVSNLSLNLLVSLRYPDEEITSLARVKVPVGTGIPRFLRLPDRDTFVPLESVMSHNLDLLFPGMVVEGCERFRVTRNANTVLDEEEADDLLALIETGLRERRFAPVVRLEVDSSMSERHRGLLAAELGLNEQADVFPVDGMMAMGDLTELAELRHPALHYPAFHPTDHHALADDGSIFHNIRRNGPFLLHHPYQSFDTSVGRLLREASRDPKVRAIKMTVYRTSAGSQVIGPLIDAARNGKQVAVVVELKARFDEAANIRWASHLEETGVHVTYGVMGLKTHCKTILVVRQDHDRLRRYVHLGTGNYHAETSRLYSDLGILTCDDTIGEDVTELFNYLTTGYKPKRNYQKLLPAPKHLKQALLDKIGREIVLHSDESPGLIQFKVNALEDADITRALYDASRAGVKIDLIVRDTCRLRPGIPHLSHNVRVISIVGRFLEHSRLYYFRNGGDEEYYLGSSDCMTRNLLSRVEVIAPVDDPALVKELRRFIDMHLADRRNAWTMQPDGSYIQERPADDEEHGSQQLLIEWAEKRFRTATRLRRRKAQTPLSRDSR